MHPGDSEVAAAAEAFAQVAKTFSTRHNIPRESWERAGVPSDVLEQAGIPSPKAKPSERTTSKRRSASSRTGQRKKRVTQGSVSKCLLGMPEGTEWTIPQVVETSGASVETVRAAVEKLVEDGQVEDTGESLHTGKRGRQPGLYRTLYSVTV